MPLWMLDEKLSTQTHRESLEPLLLLYLPTEIQSSET